MKEITNVERRYSGEGLSIDYIDIFKNGFPVGKAFRIACTNRKMANEVVLRGEDLIYMGKGVGERTMEGYIELRPKVEEEEPAREQLDRSIL